MAERRDVIRLILGVGAATLCSAAAAAPIAFITAPAKGATGNGRWIRTIKVGQLVDGQPRRIALIGDRRDGWTVERSAELGSVWLERTGNSVRALSATCPHLGCAVRRSADNKGFACPCHDSSFDGVGRRVDGPSPRDMDPLSCRVVDGYIEVELRRYRQGVPERVEVG